MAPAFTGSGVSVKVIDRSAEPLTVVVVVALLLPETESGLADVAVAVALSTVPLAVAAGTPAMMLTLRCAAGAVAPDQEQVTVPLAPTAGLTQTPPALAVAETKVVVAGNGKAMLVSCASDGPALINVAT